MPHFESDLHSTTNHFEDWFKTGGVEAMLDTMPHLTKKYSNETYNHTHFHLLNHWHRQCHIALPRPLDNSIRGNRTYLYRFVWYPRTLQNSHTHLVSFLRTVEHYSIKLYSPQSVYANKNIWKCEPFKFRHFPINFHKMNS